MGNPLPVVGSSYVAGVRERELVTASRESTVSLVTDNNGNSLYQKSYPLNPHISHKKSRPRDPYLSSAPTLDRQNVKFYREVQIIHHSSQLPESQRYAPDLSGVNVPSRSFFMKPVQSETFLDYFSASPDNYRSKATDYIDALIGLHAKWNFHLREIYLAVREGRNFLLQPRKKEDDFNLCRNYFRTIVYSVSPAFAEYLKSPSSRTKVRNAKSVRKGINQVMNSFFKDQHLEFNSFVRQFVDRDWAIGYDRQEKAVAKASGNIDAIMSLYRAGILSLVHGDFSNPSNVFVPATPGEVRACDLVNMTIAGRHVDVASALFNFYNSPNNAEKETTAIELISRYREGVQEKERITLDPQRMIIASLEDRLHYEGVRLFAIDCKYSHSEIRALVGTLPQYSGIDDEQMQRDFLHDRFIRRLTSFGDYILRGEGYRATEGVGSINVLRKNVAAVEDFLTASGVFPDLTASAKRHERVQAAARGDPPSKP